MKKHPFAEILLMVGLALVAPRQLLATDNQFINDYWMKEKASPAAPRAPRTSVPSGRTPTMPAETPNPRTPTQAAPTQALGDLVPAVRGLPPDPGTGDSYRISKDDLLKIQVFQVAELSSEERVNENGEIVMPLIGTVKVGGLSPRAAADRIATILGKDYLQNPRVDIDVTESASQQITVMGSVKKPGVFPIAGRTTLLQAIALAEGTDPLAEEEEVIVFRPRSTGEMFAYVIDLEAIQRGELPDPVLIAEDRVVVPQSGSAAFFKNITDTLRGFVRLPIY